MSIINQFRQAVEIQQRKDDESYEEQIQLPISERVAKGITMTNLKVVFEFFEHQPNQWCPHIERPLRFINSAQVYCQNNISKFREGAIVLLSNSGNEFKMQIAEDSIDNFILNYYCDICFLANPRCNFCGFFGSIDDVYCIIHTVRHFIPVRNEGL